MGTRTPDVALDQLRAKQEAATAHAEAAARAAHHAEVTAERDALADELRERYPALAGELADLLTRVRASNERVEAVNRSGGPWIDPVETVRGYRAERDQLSDHLGEAAAARS